MFKDLDGRESHNQYYLTTVKIKYYNVMIDGRNFLDQLTKNNLKTYYHVREIVTGQGYGYSTGYLLEKQYNKLNLLEIYLENEVH